MIQNCHATQGSSGSLREVGWWNSSPRQVCNASAEAAHGQIQRNCFFWGYLGGRKEQPQPAAGAVGLQGCHLQNSHNELLPTSHPSRSSSTPGPASTKSELPKITNQLRELHAAFPSWDGPADGCRLQDFSGALADKPEGKLEIKLSP